MLLCLLTMSLLSAVPVEVDSAPGAASYIERFGFRSESLQLVTGARST